MAARWLGSLTAGPSVMRGAAWLAGRRHATTPSAILALVLLLIGPAACATDLGLVAALDDRGFWDAGSLPWDWSVVAGQRQHATGLRSLLQVDLTGGTPSGL